VQLTLTELRPEHIYHGIARLLSPHVPRNENPEIPITLNLSLWYLSSYLQLYELRSSKLLLHPPIANGYCLISVGIILYTFLFITCLALLYDESLQPRKL
jgi:hypothetical protein